MSQNAKTVKQLKDEVLSAVFPSGAPENLVLTVRDGVMSPMDMMFDSTFAKISQFVPCERTNLVDIVSFCRTFFKNGMTVTDAPRGIIHRVYTICAGKDSDQDLNWKDPVFLTMVEYPELEAESQRRHHLKPFPDFHPHSDQPYTPPTTAELEARLQFPLGFVQSTSKTDSDMGRSRRGMWALHNRRIWIAPWLHSSEVIVIEWSGTKIHWEDTDLINPTVIYRDAVELYIQYLHEDKYGDKSKAAAIHFRTPTGQFVGTFDNALADLIHECREETKLRPTSGDNGCRNWLTRELLEYIPLPGDRDFHPHHHE